ncbi:hypothetical protein ACTMSW_20790 [Micromonospora sp. BQ11]|uniref:hypothetical protein n=1 Tax=Micromonospora sp. BQ11 TaxID=3452212 RepID=UPI003F8A89AB
MTTVDGTALVRDLLRHIIDEVADFRSPGPEVLAAYQRATVAMTLYGSPTRARLRAGDRGTA